MVIKTFRVKKFLVSLATVVAAVALPAAFLASPASAINGDGVGIGAGNGSCSYSKVTWKYVKTPKQIKDSGRGNCLNTGSLKKDLNRTGARSCVQRGDELAGVFYLAKGKEWATYPKKNLKAASKAKAAKAITRTSAPKAIERVAKKKLYKNNNVIVCVFKSEL